MDYKPPTVFSSEAKFGNRAGKKPGLIAWRK